MKSSLEWCKGQKKGLRLVNPSAAMAEAFFRKAESALNMLNSAPDFVLRMRELLDHLSEKEINNLRTKLS